MDLFTLLWGSGFALIIALLAWSNEIREPRKDIRQVEEDFANTFNLPKRKLKILIKKSVKKEGETPINRLVKETSAVISIMGKFKTDEGPKGMVKIRDLFDMRENIEKYYKFRYILVIFLAFISFLLGSLAINHGQVQVIFWILNVTYNQIYQWIFFLLAILLLVSVVIIYFKEEKIIKLIDEIYDLMV
jgi:hypothetical protein